MLDNTICAPCYHNRIVRPAVTMYAVIGEETGKEYVMGVCAKHARYDYSLGKILAWNLEVYFYWRRKNVEKKEQEKSKDVQQE